MTVEDYKYYIPLKDSDIDQVERIKSLILDFYENQATDYQDKETLERRNKCLDIVLNRIKDYLWGFVFDKYIHFNGRLDNGDIKFVIYLNDEVYLSMEIDVTRITIYNINIRLLLDFQTGKDMDSVSVFNYGKRFSERFMSAIKEWERLVESEDQ